MEVEGDAYAAKDLSSKRMKHRAVAMVKTIAKIVWDEGILHLYRALDA